MSTQMLRVTKQWDVGAMGYCQNIAVEYCWKALEHLSKLSQGAFKISLRLRSPSYMSQHCPKHTN